MSGPEDQVEFDVLRQSYADQVYDYIKHLILSGEIGQGEKIVEEKIARRFGVSRTPIRQALLRLAEYGLIYTKPRSYAEVVQIDREEARQIAQVRAHMERLSFTLFIDCAEEEDFAAVQKLIEDAEKALEKKDKASYFEIDGQIHLEIARRSGNRHLYEIFEKFDAKVQLLRLTQDLSVDELRVYMKQHYELLAAMRSGDKERVLELLDHHIVHHLG